MCFLFTKEWETNFLCGLVEGRAFHFIPLGTKLNQHKQPNNFLQPTTFSSHLYLSSFFLPHLRSIEQLCSAVGKVSSKVRNSFTWATWFLGEVIVTWNRFIQIFFGRDKKSRAFFFFPQFESSQIKRSA